MYLIESEFQPEAANYRGRPQKPLLILQDFLRRDRKVMEVVFSQYEYKDAASCRSTFAKAIRYYRLDAQVAVRLCDRKVYLVRLQPGEVLP